MSTRRGCNQERSAIPGGEHGHVPGVVGAQKMRREEQARFALQSLRCHCSNAGVSTVARPPGISLSSRVLVLIEVSPYGFGDPAMPLGPLPSAERFSLDRPVRSTFNGRSHDPLCELAIRGVSPSGA